MHSGCRQYFQSSNQGLGKRQFALLYLFFDETNRRNYILEPGI